MRIESTRTENKATSSLYYEIDDRFKDFMFESHSLKLQSSETNVFLHYQE